MGFKFKGCSLKTSAGRAEGKWQFVHFRSRAEAGFPSTLSSPLPLFTGVKFSELQMKQKDLGYIHNMLQAALGKQPRHLGPAQGWLCPVRAGEGLIPSTVLGHSGCASAPVTAALPAHAQKAQALLSALATGSDEWGQHNCRSVFPEIQDERGPVGSSSLRLLGPAPNSTSPVLCPVWMNGSGALRLQEFALKQYPRAKRFNS